MSHDISTNIMITDTNSGKIFTQNCQCLNYSELINVLPYWNSRIQLKGAYIVLSLTFFYAMIHHFLAYDLFLA